MLQSSSTTTLAPGLNDFVLRIWEPIYRRGAQFGKANKLANHLEDPRPARLLRQAGSIQRDIAGVGLPVVAFRVAL